MAGNDFSLDPFQVEEDNLAEQYKRALLKTLRPTPEMSDFSARAYNAYDRTSGQQEMADVQSQRKALGDRFQSSLTNALRGQDPEVRDLAMNPATRTQGLALMQKRQQMRLDQEEMNAMGGGGGGSALAQSSFEEQYQQALRMAMSSNPTIAARGKTLLEQMKLSPATNSVRTLPSGKTMADPVAEASAYRQNFNKEMALNPEGMKVPDGQGGFKLIPWSQVQSERAAPSPGGAGPATVPPTSPPMPVSGPNMPASGGPTGTPRLNFSGALSPAETAAISKDVPNPIPDPNPRYASTAEAEAAGAFGNAPAPLQRPNAGVGNTDPIAQDIYKTTVEGREKTFQKNQERGSEIPQTEQALNRMEQIGETYTGMSAIPMALEGAISTISGGKSTRGRNTEMFNKYSSDLRAAIIKQYGSGNGISDADLKATLDRIPNADMDPRVRSTLIKQIREDMQAYEWMAPRIRASTEIGVPLAEAQNSAWRAYRAQKQNPTQAGSATKSALPASVAASGEATPAKSVTSEEWGDQGQPSERSSVLDFLGEKRSYEEMGNALPATVGRIVSAPFTKSGRAGIKDAYGNIIEGGKEFLGFGDREAAASDLARQEARAASDPAYAASRTFNSVFNPTAAIGGTSPTVLKTALAAYVQGVLHPNESWTGQNMRGLASAATVAPFAAAANIIPTTRLSEGAKGVNREGRGDYLLKQFPDFNPTSHQARAEGIAGQATGVDKAAAADQMLALNKSIIEKAGIKGDIFPEKIAANETRLGEVWNNIFPKGRVITATPQDQAALADAIAKTGKVEDVTGKSPALARLYEAIKPKPAEATTAAPAAAAQKASSNIVLGETAEEWAKRTGWKPQTKAQYTAAAEARVLPETGPGRHVGPLEKEAIQANQNHLDAIRAEEDAKFQLMQSIIKDEFGYRGPVRSFKATPQQAARLKAAEDGMDRSFSEETARLSAAAQEAAKAERAANMAAADKAAREYAGKGEKPNLGPSDAPPHPTNKGKPKPKEEPKTFKFDAANLHEAWKDVAKVGGDPEATKQVRDIIAGMIERHLGADALAKFRQANNQWGITQDLKRIYSGGGGEGKGAMSGNITAETFIKRAGEHPLSKDTDEVAQAIHRFQVYDPTSIVTPTNSFVNMGKRVAGEAMYHVDKWGQKVVNTRSSEKAKRIAEMLRAIPRASTTTTNIIGEE